MHEVWVVAKVKPNQDKIAIQNLRNQGFENYYPRTLELKRTRQGMQRCPVPLFPSYIFIHIHANSRWASINSTHGVSGLLTCSGVPALVSDTVIDSLRQREQGGFIQLPKQRFTIGDTVSINSGPFVGQQALVEQMSAKERQKVLLSLLSGGLKVLIDETALEAA